MGGQKSEFFADVIYGCSISLSKRGPGETWKRGRSTYSEFEVRDGSGAVSLGQLRDLVGYRGAIREIQRL